MHIKIKEIKGEGENIFWTHYIKNIEKGNIVIARKVQNYDLVPKSKFDFETVEKIKRADIKDIEPILPELFEWIEDPNWPIAKSLAIGLVRFGEYIIPFVKYYLNNTEGQNEICVYEYIIPLLNKADLEAIKADLSRLASKPTEFEKELEYDKFAQEYLDKLKNM